MGPEKYSTFNVASILNMKRGRLKNWIEQGFVTPSFTKPHGASGVKALFDRRGLYSIRLFQRFLDLGISRHIASEWLKIFDKVNSIQRRSVYPIFIVLERSENGGVIIRLHFSENGDVCISNNEQVDDVYVVNFENIRRYVDKILDGGVIKGGE